VTRSEYGDPDVLTVAEIPTPTPAADEVLVRVHATTVNRTDCGILQARPFVIRLFTGLRRRSHGCPGQASPFSRTADDTCRVSSAPGGQNVYLPLTTRLRPGPKVDFPVPTGGRSTIHHMSRLLADGRFRPLIDRHLPLQDVRRAYEYVLTGQKLGKDDP